MDILDFVANVGAPTAITIYVLHNLDNGIKEVNKQLQILSGQIITIIKEEKSTHL